MLRNIFLNLLSFKYNIVMTRKKINEKNLEEQIIIKIKKRESETQALKKILSAFEKKEKMKEQKK